MTQQHRYHHCNNSQSSKWNAGFLFVVTTTILAGKSQAFRPIARRPIQHQHNIPHFVSQTTPKTPSKNHNTIHTNLFSSSQQPSYQLKDTTLKQAVRMLQRASWISWWSQMILTVISTVILAFAKTSHSKDSPNLFLSGTAILISALSIVWTWGNGSRLSRRLTIKPATRGAAAHMLRRAVRVGTMLNLSGLLSGLLAAQEIIGGLALKVLTQRQSLLDGGLQPLDVLVVQANTNSLLSHFISLACLLYLTQQISKLDPPSNMED